MFTVKELIESLKQCPPDYEIEVFNFSDDTVETFNSLGIDNDSKKVTFYLNY